MLAEKNISPIKSPMIGITMGCPVGIGPEIILKFAKQYRHPEQFCPVIIGDIAVLERCADGLKMQLDIVPWQPEGHIDVDKLYVIEPNSVKDYSLNADDLQWGQPGRETGHAAAAYITKAVQLVKQGNLDAMVTCPIAKSALQLAGYMFPGHTEMLASLCNTKNYGMMMAGKRLKVSLVTIHKPLAKVPGLISRDEIMRIIDLTGQALVRDFAISMPKIAVSALNPHSGEDGLFGVEEERLIKPAVLDSVSKDWEVSGPLPPDTVFMKAADGYYDAVVAMYHDQGLIPFKLLHFEDGVNLTMGLPIVRTSVDHGTAYDIAGKGIASAASLEASFVLAAQIVGNRKKQETD